MRNKFILKKITILAFVLLLFLLPQNTYALDEPLQFNLDGQFKIMVLADIQDTKNPLKQTMQFIAAALDAEKPDLVVYCGDNVYSPSPSMALSVKATKTAISNILEPVVSRNIPFCVVMGNHDSQAKMSRHDQMEFYMSFQGCISTVGETGVGVGDYNVLIKDSSGEKTIFNLWFFDSGEKAPRSEGGGYGYVTAKQIEWYENTVAQLRDNNMGENIPSMAFQHIPVPEIYDVLNIVPKGTQGAVKGHGSFGGNYYVLNPRLAHGDLNEGPCPPDVNSGQFESWVNQGDVIAACFGHDHVNDFFGVYKGITFLQTPGVGFYSYGDADKHGIRIIELNQSELNYTTKVVYYGDLIDEPVPAHLKSIGKQMFSIILIGIALVLAVAFTIAALIIRKKRSKQRKNSISG